MARTVLAVVIHVTVFLAALIVAVRLNAAFDDLERIADSLAVIASPPSAP